MQKAKKTGLEQNGRSRGQTELLGLAVVVVLLSLGMMLILTYSSKDVPPQLKEMNEELADKFIHSLLDTTSGCDEENALTVQDLVLDVAESRPYGTIICDDGQTSFDYLNSTFEYITNETISVWKDDKYQFMVYLNKDIPIYFFGSKNCRSKTGKEYLSPIKGTPVYITLYVCS